VAQRSRCSRKLGTSKGEPSATTAWCGAGQSGQRRREDNSIDDIRLVAFPLRRQRCGGEPTNGWGPIMAAALEADRSRRQRRDFCGLGWHGEMVTEDQDRTEPTRTAAKEKYAHEGIPGKRNGHHLLRAYSTLISRPHSSLVCPLSASSFESTRAGSNVYPSGRARAPTFRDTPHRWNMPRSGRARFHRAHRRNAIGRSGIENVFR